MKDEEQIFNLIHQLNKGEKRSIKLYLNNYNDNMAFIFDCLNKMKSYDEQNFERKLCTKITPENLDDEKENFRTILLNALNDLYYNKNEELTFGDIMNKIELGLKFRLVKITKEWIDKGYEYAEQKQDPLVKVIIQQLELNYTWLINASIDARIELSEMQRKSIETIDENKF